MVRLILLGGPGSGRGTQLENLHQNLKVPQMSMGSILREAIATGTALGKTAKTYVAKGELVPDSMLIQFMQQRLLEADVIGGWLLEGYPRTAFQAEEMDFLLGRLAQSLTAAVYLKVSEWVMLDRCLKRGQTEDKSEIVKKRISNFEAATVPILEYYDLKGKLITINGEQSPERVTAEILEKI